MATASAPVVRNSFLRPKYLVFAFVGLMMAYVIPHNESFLVNSGDPIWRHYQPFRWYLLPHGIAGACALLIGPMQFSERLRKRYTRLHRVLGRIYIGGALIAAPLGFYIQHFEERSGAARSFSIAAAVDAVLWIITTAIAFLFILRGNVTLHRQWMTRSFAVAIVFLEVRVILGLTGWDRVHDGSIDETVVWTCLAFSLLAADIVLQWPDLVRRRVAKVRSTATPQMAVPASEIV
jgi:uncharacterized membrane protein